MSKMKGEASFFGVDGDEVGRRTRFPTPYAVERKVSVLVVEAVEAVKPSPEAFVASVDGPICGCFGAVSVLASYPRVPRWLLGGEEIRHIVSSQRLIGASPLGPGLQGWNGRRGLRFVSGKRRVFRKLLSVQND